ncbi:MAG: MarR family transcriptional regulator [Clostridiales bacterium]|nr:MarR family transcriptional regulator [Clostridiales bacterium]
MMDSFEQELNKLLVDTYRSILKVEESTIKSSRILNLSINEMHMLESIAKNEKGVTISDIAQDLDITLPSVTVAINKLQRKGYVQKIKNSDDGRKVNVVLTKLGKKVNAVHQYFHEQMTKDISREFTKEEKNILLKGVFKLNEFFNSKIKELEKTR